MKVRMRIYCFCIYFFQVGRELLFSLQYKKEVCVMIESNLHQAQFRVSHSNGAWYRLLNVSLRYLEEKEQCWVTDMRKLVICNLILGKILTLQNGFHFQNGSGDANDFWRISVVKYPGEDRKIKTVKTVFRLIHATTGCALMETENLLPKWCVVKCLFCDNNPRYIPNRHLLVQGQQWKYQNNMWNLFKFNNKDVWHRFVVFIVNFEQMSHIALVFQLLTLNK